MMFDQKTNKLYIYIREIVYALFRYKEEFRFMGFKQYIAYAIAQRVFRVNSNVPWPVHWSSIVSSPQNITFRREQNPLGYSPGSYIQAINGIVVGTNVIHAVGLSVITANHDYQDFKKHVKVGPVRIGDNCWLGVNVTILPGVELGPHTIVAAGCVVAKSFPEGNCVVAGVPARVVKQIPEYRGECYFLSNSDLTNPLH